MAVVSAARSPSAAAASVEDVDFTITSRSTLMAAVGTLENDSRSTLMAAVGTSENDKVKWRHRQRRALADYATYTEISPCGHQDEVIDAGAVPLLVQLITGTTDEAKKYARVALGAIVALNERGQDQSHGAIAPLVGEIASLWRGNVKQRRWGLLCSALVALCILVDSNGANQRAARDAEARAILPLMREIRDLSAKAFTEFCRATAKISNGKTLDWDNYWKIKDGESDLRTQHQIQCSARMLLSLLDDESSVGMLRVTTPREGYEAIECMQCAPELLSQWKNAREGNATTDIGGVAQMRWLEDNGGTGSSLVYEYPVDRAQLLWAVTTANLGMMAYLVGKGANIKTIDESTAPVLCISSLRRVAAKYLLHHGADVNAANSLGQTPLHVAVRNKGNVKLIRTLIREGAKLDARDKHGATPLQYLVTREHPGIEDLSFRVTNERYTSTLILCSEGATWDYDAYLKSSKDFRHRMRTKDDKSNYARMAQWRLGLGVCVKHWIDEHKAGVRLTEVDQKTIGGGEDAVETHFQELANAPYAEQIRRHKVCLIGSSKSGKTSLVASLYWGEEARAKLEDRTIGIDLLELSFRTGVGDGTQIQHEVTFWDFAGQDIYQGVHAPFFTRKTLYLLCVDLDAVYKKFTACPGTLARHRFIDEHVCSWARLVLLRQPEAEFKVVCTKRDMLTDKEVKTAKRWLSLYVSEWQKEWSRNLNETKAHNLTALKSSLTGLKEAAEAPLVTSSATDMKARAAQSDIRNLIATRQTAHVLSSSGLYAHILKKIRDLRLEEVVTDDHCAHVEHVVVDPTWLKDLLTSEMESGDLDKYDEIMDDLHEHGDIIKHDDYIVLEPMIVLNLTREIVSHRYKNTSGEDYDTLRATGRLTHKLLMTFPTWSKVKENKKMLRFFKVLLQNSNLAYPTLGEMKADSDLMVPTYWNVKPAIALEDHGISGAKLCRWQYETSATMAPIIIKEFAVKSYHVYHVREVFPSYMLISDQDKFEASISFTVSGDDNKVAILVEVGADDEETSWQELSYFVSRMEAVLDAYPSLDVERDILYGENCDPHSVQEAVTMISDVKNFERLRTDHPWIPLEFDWFIEQAWKNPGKKKEIETRQTIKNIDRKQEVIKTLVATSEHRPFPALFSVKYSDDTERKVRLAFYSDLTGVCHHEPVEIGLPDGFLDKNAKWLQVAIPLFSIASSVVLSSAVVDTAMKQVAPGVEKRARRVQIADDLTRGFKLHQSEFTSDSCEPAEAQKMVTSLLKFRDDAFEPADIFSISELECVYDDGTGAYLWVHPSEMVDLPQLHRTNPQTLRKRAASSAPTAKFTLQIQGADGLAKGVRKWYCTWRLVREGNSGEASALRATQKSRGPHVGEVFRLDDISSLTELRKRSLEVIVMGRGYFSYSELAKGVERLANAVAPVQAYCIKVTPILSVNVVIKEEAP